MLISLHIENLAVIKNIDIDFKKGFTVLTGETGAGKSVILDGISLLLGAKADKELIRTGETYAMISGVFSIKSDMLNVLDDLGITPDEDGNIFLQRTVSLDGRSSIKINGRSVTLSILKILSGGLVSIHGQGDTVALTDADTQLDLLDIYSGNKDLLSKYNNEYFKFDEIRKKINEISEKSKEKERLSEILAYQIKDIDSYGLYVGEEEELVERKLKIKNCEKLTKNAGFTFKALKGSEKGSVVFLLDRSATALDQISDVLPKFKDYAENLRDYLYQIDDIAECVYSEIADMDSNPDEKLNDIESRLDKISKLKRKYGYTIKDILEFRDKAQSELETLDNYDSIIKKLYAEEKAAYESALLIAEELHKRRTTFALEIEQKVKDTLEFLDMPKVVFFASIKQEYADGKKLLTSTGFDNVEFYISANRGAEPQPLSKVASGGELARVMLALISVIADKDGTSTVIFDEIDSGVSGKTARKIGIKMLQLAESTQLFTITHSAQIASLADVHYLISKSDVNCVTETRICELDREGRINELSRILGGIDVTESQRAAAIDMLDEKT